MSSSSPALACIATTAAGLFAGSALYISVVQHPSLLKVPTDTAFRTSFFRTMFPVVAPMQASLAVVSGAAAISTGVLNSSAIATPWIATGTLIIAIVPYTRLAMMQLNWHLLDAPHCEKKGEAWIEASLVKWGKLHAVRTGTSLAAFAGMVVLLCSVGKSRA